MAQSPAEKPENRLTREEVEALVANPAELKRLLETNRELISANRALIAEGLINAIRSNQDLAMLEGLMTNPDIVAVAQSNNGIAMLLGLVVGDITMQQVVNLSKNLKKEDNKLDPVARESQEMQREARLADDMAYAIAENKRTENAIPLPSGKKIGYDSPEILSGASAKVEEAFAERQITAGQKNKLDALLGAGDVPAAKEALVTVVAANKETADEVQVNDRHRSMINGQRSEETGRSPSAAER